jgi:topoisomerase-4 subunit A
MVVLEKWNPKPISAIYFDGEKSAITSNAFGRKPKQREPLSQIVSTDYRPVAELAKVKGVQKKNQVDVEAFIAVKGFKAQGNQLTADKLKQVNLLNHSRMRSL